jgi:hypothetical protein
MEALIIMPFFILIVLVLGLILMHPMKVIQIVVPWFVVAVSAFLFALGWEWNRKGELLREDFHISSEYNQLGHAISDLGNTIECIGILGALVGLALFGALWYLGAYKKQIRRLEAEVERLCRSLPVLSAIAPLSDTEEDKRVNSPREPGIMGRESPPAVK